MNAAEEAALKRIIKEAIEEALRGKLVFPGEGPKTDLIGKEYLPREHPYDPGRFRSTGGL